MVGIRRRPGRIYQTALTALAGKKCQRQRLCLRPELNIRMSAVVGGACAFTFSFGEGFIVSAEDALVFLPPYPLNLRQFCMLRLTVPLQRGSDETAVNLSMLVIFARAETVPPWVLVVACLGLAAEL